MDNPSLTWQQEDMIDQVEATMAIECLIKNTFKTTCVFHIKMKEES